MLRYGIAVMAAFVAALLLTNVYAGGTVTSGPQVEKTLPGPFESLNVTGAHKGKKFCLYCSNADKPVAAVFAREASPAIAKLLKQLDDAAMSNASIKMGAYAIFCSDTKGLDKQLVKLADDQKLQKFVLAIDKAAGPDGYEISKDADVTVLLYKEAVVKANHSFRKGELNDAAIAKIVADVTKITK
jgi:hypothetical protein